MIEINLERSEKYVLACSYGPDSMCLMDLLLKNHIDFIVAHVNYHILSNADEDETNLRNYCKEHNVKFYLKSVIYEKSMGNEEDRARKFRYDFFKKLCKELNIPNLLIAHQQDDNIETYYLQIERKNFVSCYGLKSYYTFDEINFIRPLLNYSKAQIMNYCKENRVPFSIDYSNFNQKFKRNYYRHSVVAKLNEQERFQLIQKINSLNLEKELQKIKLQKFYKALYLIYDEIKDFSEEKLIATFYYFVSNKGYFIEISKGQILDFMQKCSFRKGNFIEKLKDNFCLEFSYGRIYFFKNITKYYECVITEKNDNKNFKIERKSPLFLKYNINFPLIIKPVSSKEEFKINGNLVKVSRCFINWKVPGHLRKCWPGIYNQKGKLLYVPHYQENPTINENSLLLFKIEDLFNF